MFRLYQQRNSKCVLGSPSVFPITEKVLERYENRKIVRHLETANSDNYSSALEYLFCLIFPEWKLCTDIYYKNKVNIPSIKDTQELDVKYLIAYDRSMAHAIESFGFVSELMWQEYKNALKSKARSFLGHRFSEWVVLGISISPATYRSALSAADTPRPLSHRPVSV